MHGAGVAGLGRALVPLPGAGVVARDPTPLSYIEPSRYWASARPISPAFSNQCAAAWRRARACPSTRRAPISYWAGRIASGSRRRGRSISSPKRRPATERRRLYLCPVGVGIDVLLRDDAGRATYARAQRAVLWSGVGRPVRRRGAERRSRLALFRRQRRPNRLGWRLRLLLSERRPERQAALPLHARDLIGADQQHDRANA